MLNRIFSRNAFLAFLLVGCSSYYSGPLSDHFDGQRFFYPYAQRSSRSFWQFLKWRMTRKGNEPPLNLPRLERENDPLPKVDGNSLVVTFIGHATFLIQTQGKNILTDPIWSERASPVSWAGPKRMTPPGISMEKLPPIDVVLISHNHYDHLDLPTIKLLQEKYNPLFFVPLGNDTIIKGAVPAARVKALDWSEGEELNSNVKIILEPAQHWSARGLFDKNKALWGSFVIALPKGIFYFSGDTGFGDGSLFKNIAKKYPKVVGAILPIGAYEPRWFMEFAHMTPDEAVKAYTYLGMPPTVASHFNTFILSDEAFGAPVEKLKAALSQQPNGSDFRALLPGERWELPA